MANIRIRPVAAIILLLLIVPSPAPLGFQADRAVAEAAWSTPVKLSTSPAYDNTPAVAASANGAALVVWPRNQGFDPVGNYLPFASNAFLGAGFQEGQLSSAGPNELLGSVHVRHDSLNRKHVVWWQYEGSDVCDYYARFEADGHLSIKEKVPDSCGQSFKNTALAVGVDNSVQALFGRNLYNLQYWVRTDAGWTVRKEPIPNLERPEAPTIGETSGGVVLAVWKGSSAAGKTDIFGARRLGPGNWQVEDLSPVVPECKNGSTADGPSLAADPSGGMRLLWSEERCDPNKPEPTTRDPYYREWTPGAGWNALAPVRVARAGNALGDAIAVDSSGVAYLVWVDTNPLSTIYYSKGRGSSFSAPLAPFAGWARGQVTKDVSLDYNSGYLHLAFSSPREDPLKDAYYSYVQVSAPAPAPNPPPAPPAAQIPGGGSHTFPETGQTVTGVFLNYWNAHGGLRQQGYPISGVVREVSAFDHKPYAMQYFERATFEYHPENKPPYDVLLSQLGTSRYKQNYPTGAPNQRVNPDAGRTFTETGHRVGGSFWLYWSQNGGLAQQGYPISDELAEVSAIDHKTYIVQYFERAVFEWHSDNQPPNNVLLSLLGDLQYRQKYGSARPILVGERVN